MSNKRWLIVCQSAPYVGDLAIAALDAAMAAGAFGQAVSVLFRGAAVAQLSAALDPPADQRHIGKTVQGLELYDVERIYASTSDRHHVAETISELDIAWLSDNEVRDLIADAQHVVTF